VSYGVASYKHTYSYYYYYYYYHYYYYIAEARQGQGPAVHRAALRGQRHLHHDGLARAQQGSEKGEALLRGVLTLRFVSHAQPARLWKAGCLQIICSWFGNPPQKWFLGAGFLGAPPLFLM